MQGGYRPRNKEVVVNWCYCLRLPGCASSAHDWNWARATARRKTAESPTGAIELASARRGGPTKPRKGTKRMRKFHLWVCWALVGCASASGENPVQQSTARVLREGKGSAEIPMVSG